MFEAKHRISKILHGESLICSRSFKFSTLEGLWLLKEALAAKTNKVLKKGFRAVRPLLKREEFYTVGLFKTINFKNN